MERAAGVAALIAMAAGLLVLSGALFALPRPAVAVSLAALAQSAAFALLAVGGARLLPGSLAARLGLGAGSLPGRTVALLALGTMGLSQSLDLVIHLAGLGEVGVLAELDASLRGARGWTLVLAALGVAVAPGVAEELLFRGLIQGGLARRLGGRRGGGALAVLLASALFGGLHLDGVHSPAAFVLGLYLGTIVYLAGSVRAAIFCHVVNNGGALLESAFDLPAAGPTIPLLAAGLGIAGAALLLGFRDRRLPRAGLGAVVGGVVAGREPVGQGVAAHREPADGHDP